MLYGLAKPFLFSMDAEKAHNLALSAVQLLPARSKNRREDLAVELAGLRFPNPIGLAAGFDKNAQAVAPLLGLGFGSVEAGTVTPNPQPGNPKPRLFRLKEDRAVINRFGFNNEGHEAYIANLIKQRKKAEKAAYKGVIGGNVGANKTSTDQIADYVSGIERVGPHADYLTINISSPNTPGLRALQADDHLKPLLQAAGTARRRTEDSINRHLPLFVKLAPDMDQDALKSALDLIMAAKMDAVILTNTTIDRPDSLVNQHSAEAGGLSGAPLKEKSRQSLNWAADHLKNSLPIISVGGIDSAAEAALRLSMGASLIQIYSVLVYEGPYLVPKWLDTIRDTNKAS